MKIHVFILIARDKFLLPATELRMKMTLFKHYSQTKKQVFFTFMSTYGVVKNENWGIIDKEFTLDALFSLA